MPVGWSVVSEVSAEGLERRGGGPTRFSRRLRGIALCNLSGMPRRAVILAPDDIISNIDCIGSSLSLCEDEESVPGFPVPNPFGLPLPGRPASSTTNQSCICQGVIQLKCLLTTVCGAILNLSSSNYARSPGWRRSLRVKPNHRIFRSVSPSTIPLRRESW